MIKTGIGYSQSQWDNIGIHNLFATQSRGRFFHYTSFANAKDMLKIEKGTMLLFASHFLFLNDSQEFKEGLSLLIKKLDDFTKEQKLNPDIKKTCQEHKDKFLKDSEILSNAYPNHFIISFCKSGNALSQWKYYGKDCGIAIEYDLKNLKYDGFCAWTRKNLGKHPVYDVLYKEDQKEKELDRILGRLNTISSDFAYHTENIIMCACAAVSFMKSKYFYEEKESRLLFAPIYDDTKALSEENSPMKLVQYREASGKIKPYLKISVRHKDCTCVPIKSVTVGPGQNQIQIFNAIVMLIQSYYPGLSAASKKDIILSEDTVYKDGCRFADVNGIRVRLSSIPFRD